MKCIKCNNSIKNKECIYIKHKEDKEYSPVCYKCYDDKNTESCLLGVD